MKKRKKYTAEFKRETIRLAETSGERISEIERDLGLWRGCISGWRRELKRKGEEAFPGHGRLTATEERIRELERENEILRQERDILKKAVAIFTHPSE
jgi:transposase